MKEVKIVFSQESKEVYEYLNKEAPTSKNERTLLRAVKQKIKFIRSNPHYGDPISKKLIPKKYIKQYGITNLFRVELPNFWRMIYNLSEGESKIEVVAFVLEIMNHKKYNKRFGYK